MPNALPHRIEILAFKDAQLLDITGPAQVFATANDLTPSGAPKPYAIAIVSANSDVATSSGIVLRSDALPQSASGPATLIVSGGFGINAACRDRALLDWIHRRAASATRTASVCSGAFLLAEAGLLDGRRAVTHWGRCAEFAARFPAVHLDPDPIFVRDGPIWTSAGVTAGIDLALAMVEADKGRPLALAVARQLVVFLKRPGGQAQFSATLALQGADETFERLHSWIANHLDHDLSLSVLADQASMSLRSFSPALSKMHRPHAGGKCRDDPGRKRPTASGGRRERDANRRAMRLRLGRDHAARLSPTPRRSPQRIPE